MLARAFENAVSALCYSFIAAHFGARGGEPGPRWNRTVRFVLDQHGRMPDYLRLPLKVLTLLFVCWSNLPRLTSYRSLDPDGRWRRVERMRRSRIGPFRDLIRFYEGLTIFGFHAELGETAAGPDAAVLAAAEGASANRADSPDAAAQRTANAAASQLTPVINSEIVVIGSGPGGAITACLLA